MWEHHTLPTFRILFPCELTWIYFRIFKTIFIPSNYRQLLSFSEISFFPPRVCISIFFFFFGGMNWVHRNYESRQWNLCENDAGSIYWDWEHSMCLMRTLNVPHDTYSSNVKRKRKDANKFSRRIFSMESLLYMIELQFKNQNKLQFLTTKD